MGMDFGDGPDFDAIKEEREKAKKGEEKKVELTENDCWEYLTIVQKFDPIEGDNGLRIIYKNTLTNRHRMKKQSCIMNQIDPHNNTPKYSLWDWDGEAYEV